MVLKVAKILRSCCLYDQSLTTESKVVKNNLSRQNPVKTKDDIDGAERDRFRGLPRELVDKINAKLSDVDSASLASTCRELFSTRNRSRREKLNISAKIAWFKCRLSTLEEAYAQEKHNASIKNWLFSEERSVTFCVSKIFIWERGIDLIYSDGVRKPWSEILIDLQCIPIIMLDLTTLPFFAPIDLLTYYFGSVGWVTRYNRDEARRKFQSAAQSLKCIEEGADLLSKMRKNESVTTS